MIVLATEIGFVLQFDSVMDLETVIKHLQGQLEWVKEHDVKPPYLYMTSHDNIPAELMQAFLNTLKPEDMDQVEMNE